MEITIKTSSVDKDGKGPEMPILIGGGIGSAISVGFYLLDIAQNKKEFTPIGWVGHTTGGFVTGASNAAAIEFGGGRLAVYAVVGGVSSGTSTIITNRADRRPWSEGFTEALVIGMALGPLGGYGGTSINNIEGIGTEAGRQFIKSTAAQESISNSVLGGNNIINWAFNYYKNKGSNFMNLVKRTFGGYDSSFGICIDQASSITGGNSRSSSGNSGSGHSGRNIVTLNTGLNVQASPAMQEKYREAGLL